MGGAEYPDPFWRPAAWTGWRVELSRARVRLGPQGVHAKQLRWTTHSRMAHALRCGAGEMARAAGSRTRTVRRGRGEDQREDRRRAGRYPLVACEVARQG